MGAVLIEGSLVEEWGESVGDAEEEDGSDDEAVGCGERRDDGLNAGPVGCTREDAGGRRGHQGVHHEQAHDKGEQADEAAAGASEVCGEKEEQELRGGFGTKAMDDPDDEDRALVVLKGEGFGLGYGGIEAATELPTGVARPRD